MYELEKYLDKKAFLHMGLLYAIASIIFYVTSKSLDYKDLRLAFLQFIVPMVGIYIIEWMCKKPLFTCTWSVPLCVSFTWFGIIPILHKVNSESIAILNNRQDILFGLYLLLLLMCLYTAREYIQQKFSRISWIYTIFLSIFSFVICIIPAAEIAHFFIYQFTISETSIIAIQETNIKEAVEYVLAYVGIFKTFLVLLVSVAIFCFFLYYNRYYVHYVENNKMIWCALVFVIPLAVYMPHLMQKTSFFSMWNEVYQYRQKEASFKQNYQNRYDGLVLSSKSLLPMTTPGSVIIVIGESASRNYMKAYTPDFPYDDTPWLSSLKKDKNFIVFNNVYSCYNQTSIALSQVFTEKSQYNDKDFSDSISIIDVAKKAGYHTCWLTNQGGVSKDDTPMTLLMNTADYHDSPQIDTRLQYDGDLLPLLKKINSDDNNLIIVHLMGSHALYQTRYPSNKKVFDLSTPEGNYANTILYTDEILASIFNYAKEHLKLQVMIYVSDHGENVYHGHHPNIKTFDNVRIPMFVYLSPEYQYNYPSQSHILRSHQDEYFTNDMMYNTISGILNAQSNHYDEREDFSSPNYGFSRNTLWTFNHTIPLINDSTVNT